MGVGKVGDFKSTSRRISRRVRDGAKVTSLLLLSVCSACMPSQAIASSSAKCKADRPPRNFVSGQSFTLCDIVCDDAPQEQDGSEA